MSTPNELPEKACYSDIFTKWRDNKLSNTWLQYDLQRDYTIKKIGLVWEHCKLNNIYKVQTSTGGVTWTDRISETTNTKNTYTYDVDWNSIRFVRFLVPKEIHDDAVRLMGFQAWVRGGMRVKTTQS